MDEKLKEEPLFWIYSVKDFVRKYIITIRNQLLERITIVTSSPSLSL